MKNSCKKVNKSHKELKKDFYKGVNIEGKCIEIMDYKKERKKERKKK